MPLLFSSTGDEFTLKTINGSPEIKHHLSEMGFLEGEKVSVVQKIATGFIVKVKDARVAIDRSMASKIFVESIRA